MDAAVAPAGILSCQAQHQQADGADSARTARTAGVRPGGVAAHQQVPVPAQHCLWPDQQPEPAEHIPWEPVQQSGQERPVDRREPGPDLAQLPLQHRDLVT